MENKEAVGAQLKRILLSEVFSGGNEKFSRLLEYVVRESLAGRHVNEETLATDFYKKALDRPAPGADKPSFVRVDMGKLRDKLEEYYDHAGWEDEWLIKIPKPGYVPSFTQRTKALPESGNRVLKITIVAEADRFDDLVGVHAALCAVSGDPNLRIRGMSVGSVVIHVECSEEGYQRLCEAMKDGRLSEALGYEVKSLELDNTNLESLAEAASRLGRRISEPPTPSDPSGTAEVPSQEQGAIEQPLRPKDSENPSHKPS